LVFALSKKVATFLDQRLDFEIEGQVAEHFGPQKHAEINPVVVIARWKSFPWNKTLPTTIAIGDGLSIATEKPHLEVKRRGHQTSRVLNYVKAEITLSLPCVPQWALIAVYHHRSGAFGAFHGVEDASTAFAAGFRYWFDKRT
jgi:hypothetical protein